MVFWYHTSLPLLSALWTYARSSAQRELAEVQIRVKAANSAVGESNQFLKKLPEYLKNVEKALVPLRK